jgi:hypothetical protein
MFSRIHNKLGTAGLIVAVVALVAAVAGTAFAAVGLNPQQKKEVKKIAKKFAGKPGPVGPVGPTGPVGPKGETGGAGAAGKNGESVKLSEATGCTSGGTKLTVGSESKEVCNGEDGESVTGDRTTLGPGETATGNWSFYNKDILGAFVTISFPLRLPSAPDFNWIAADGSGDTTACPGSPSEPLAEPGEFCMYAESVVAAGADADHHPVGLGSYSPDRTSGLTVEFGIESGQEGYGWGTWAVTAPE